MWNDGGKTATGGLSEPPFLKVPLKRRLDEREEFVQL